MRVDVDRGVALHAAVAIRSHIRALRRDGVEAPAGLMDLAAALQRHAEGPKRRDEARARELSRRRSAAYRERKRQRPAA
jgi:hypothetical protein